jgi:methylthioribose-1-phosphate isomerase
MARAEAALGEAPDGVALADALRVEADSIAGGLQMAHASVAAALAGRLAELSDRATADRDGALCVLLHGDPGALWGGSVGTAITALARLAGDGRPLRVFVTETRPFMEGARLAGWELRQAGIAYRVVPDGAVAWLLDREVVDAVVLAAEWIAANGDTGAVIGSRSVALLAGLATAPAMATATVSGAGRTGPEVIVAAAAATIDPLTPDGSAIPVELRPARELETGPRAEQPPAGAKTTWHDALNPACDVVPAAAIGSIVTERGAARPVSPRRLAELADPGA